ncbi:MAG: CsiV family protein [Gammaproteobacteria bacterium]|jgi:hypothetical protein|nr:CsiV family protein [Gammaproteobacteria bacterium]
MKRTFFSFLACVAISAAAVAANAETDPWFQVEIVVFEHTGAAAEAGLWQGELELPALPAGAVPLRTAPAVSVDESEPSPTPAGLAHQSGEAAFLKLEDDRQQLASVLNRLLVTPRYAPLFYAAWLQPATTDASFAGVRLAAEEENLEALDVTATTGLLSEPLITASTRGPFPTSAQPAIDGVVRLSRGRFLHLALDLRYRRSGDTPEGMMFSIFGRETERESLYRLTQSRRVRSGELHYFDHPRFGAVVLLTPYPAAADTSR